MRITAIVHATRKRCDRAKSTTRLGLRVSLYAQMLTSEMRTELASTHMNVDNVSELTSKRLRTDFYTFANCPETFAKRPLAKRLTFQDATKTEQATLVDAETQTEEFDNKVIGQDAMETEQATMLDEETQTEEFDYLFQRPNRYSPPDIDLFDTDDKIRSYTGLPTKEILITTLQHVAPHVPRRSTTLNNFQEFVLVLMKFRLNMPVQELVFRFGVNVTTISRIFFVLDYGDGRSPGPTNFLARKRSTLEDYACFLSIFIWQEGDSNY